MKKRISVGRRKGPGGAKAPPPPGTKGKAAAGKGAAGKGAAAEKNPDGKEGVALAKGTAKVPSNLPFVLQALPIVWPQCIDNIFV